MGLESKDVPQKCLHTCKKCEMFEKGRVSIHEKTFQTHFSLCGRQINFYLLGKFAKLYWTRMKNQKTHLSQSQQLFFLSLFLAPRQKLIKKLNMINVVREAIRLLWQKPRLKNIEKVKNLISSFQLPCQKFFRKQFILTIYVTHLAWFLFGA